MTCTLMLPFSRWNGEGPQFELVRLFPRAFDLLCRKFFTRRLGNLEVTSIHGRVIS